MVPYDLTACIGIALTFNLPTSTELKLLSSQFRFRYKAEMFSLPNGSAPHS